MFVYKQLISGSFWRLLALLCVSLAGNGQSIYYVANTGNDSNDGRSVRTPFKSLTKVSTLLLKGGDAVLFRRGDVFSGTLLIKRSGAAGKPIVFDGYGTGNKPVFTGAIRVNNWTKAGDNIWQAYCATCGNRVTGMYRYDTSLPLGRFPDEDEPNRGGFTIQSHVGATQLTSQQPLTIDWTGAEVVVRPTYWIIDRAVIAQQKGNTLTLTNPSTYPLADGWGYFFQNHPATLNREGEWCYHAKNKVIQLYSTNVTPTTENVKVTTVDRVIDISGASFITIQNLHITQALATNLYAQNVSNLVLKDTDFTNAGEDAVVIAGTGKTILVEDCSFRNINNNGFYIGAYRDVVFRRNSIHNVGTWEGRGKNGDGQFSAFQSSAIDNTLVENNLIDSIGYNGISVKNNTTVRRNRVSNFCLTKSDGGGVYLWNGTQLPMRNITVESNIIQNGIGTYGSLAEQTPGGANGIFLDDCVEEVDLIDNTIFGCQGIGIHLHAVSKVNLIRNTCFDNSQSQLVLYKYDSPCIPRNNTFTQNVLVAKTVNQPVAGYISTANDLASFGSMERNYYARPFNDLSTIRAVYNRNVVNDLNLAQWQNKFGQDITSKPSPIIYRSFTVESLNTSSLINNSFGSGLEGWELWSSQANGSINWRAGNTTLDGGSIEVAFSGSSNQTESYALAYTDIKAVRKHKNYVLRFDAIATADKKIVTYIRQKQEPYQDLSLRSEFMVTPFRRSYEIAFTASADEASALLAFQLNEDHQQVWFDNIQLQEASIMPVNPNNFIQLAYNPTEKDSLVLLDDSYRDVKNHYYGRQVMLRPFGSVILLKDSLPPVDVRLTLTGGHVAAKVGEVMSLSLSLHNETTTRSPAGQLQWRCRLPDGLMLIRSAGLDVKDSVVTGVAMQLISDTTFVFSVKVMKLGVYELAAEITTSTFADPDSTPNSGTDDGEDDMAVITISAREVVTAIEPNKTQPEQAQLFPNPSSEEFIFIPDHDIVSMRVVDLLGQERITHGIARQGQTIRFGRQLISAYYMLYIQYTNGEKRTIKFIKL